MKIIVLCLLSLGILSQESLKVVTHKVKVGVTIDGQNVGEFTLGLFGKAVLLKKRIYNNNQILNVKLIPKTVENFRALCTGEKNGKTYVGSSFYRIIPNFMIQGGDFTNNNGTGGSSIYGTKFQDENLTLRHELGSITMANAGPNTNGSQFFILTTPQPSLDGKHQVFGKVIENMDVLKRMESKGQQSGKPTAKVIFASCSVEVVKNEL